MNLKVVKTVLRVSMEIKCQTLAHLVHVYAVYDRIVYEFSRMHATNVVRVTSKSRDDNIAMKGVSLVSRPNPY